MADGVAQVAKSPDFLGVAKRALARHYPGALGGFVGGSITRGEGTPTSDIDIVVLFDDAYQDVHRNTVIEDGWLIEFFVHNPKAQNFYFDKDRRRGMCVMPHLVVEGIIIPEECPELLLQKKRARAVIKQGPPPLSQAELDIRRYTIAALVDDLDGAGDPAEKNAVLSLLHENLGDFYLRARGHWSGFAKSLIRCLRSEDEGFAAAFESAFASGFASGDTADLAALVDKVLAPHGGRLQEGYRSAAPADWKTFEG